ncbi:MAG: heparin lyase I family protein [Chitinophagaceae bacterium]|nr:heparin lyase I family protein [Chitinophagaceae bacterium]
MKYAIILLLSVLLITSCSNEPKKEEVSYAAVLPNSSKGISVVNESKDTMVLTLKDSTVTVTSSYTYSYTTKRVDTVWKRYVLPGTTPPTDTVVQPPVPIGYSIFYENGFDKAADRDPWGKQQYGNGYIDTAFKKTGEASFHAKPKNVSSGIRSEVQFPDGWLPSEGAIEFDINIVKRVINNAHFFQIHPKKDGASGCPAMFSRNSGLAMVFKEIPGEPEYPFFAPVLNRWYNIRFEYKMAQNNTGYWKAYVDGVLKIDKSGIRTQLDNDNWMKIGINSWLVSETANEAYYDNLKVYKKQ